MQKTKMFGTIAVLMLLTLMVADVYTDTEGTSGGTAIVGNSIPTVTNSDMKDASETGSVVNTAIDVNVEYHVIVTVGDGNQLTDLTTIDFKIWDSITSTELGADKKEDHYTFRYSEDIDAWSEVGPDVGGSHLVTGSCVDPADHTATSGTFKLAFKLHKTAQKESVTSTWKAKIIASDSGSSGNQQTIQFGVNFYLELTVLDTSHQWSNLSPGQNDIQIDQPTDGNIGVSVTANAAFKLQAKGSGPLTDAAKTIPLANVKVHKDTVGSAISLTTNYADIGGLTSLTAGESQTHTFILWISVLAGQATGTYLYTLSCQGIAI